MELVYLLVNGSFMVINGIVHLLSEPLLNDVYELQVVFVVKVTQFYFLGALAVEVIQLVVPMTALAKTKEGLFGRETSRTEDVDVSATVEGVKVDAFILKGATGGVRVARDVGLEVISVVIRAMTSLGN